MAVMRLQREVAAVGSRGMALLMKCRTWTWTAAVMGRWTDERTASEEQS